MLGDVGVEPAGYAEPGVARVNPRHLLLARRQTKHSHELLVGECGVGNFLESISYRFRGVFDRVVLPSMQNMRAKKRAGGTIPM